MDRTTQADRLIELGIHTAAGVDEETLRGWAADLTGQEGTLAIHPDVVPAATLAPYLHRGDKQGFVVQDLTDLAEFTPIDGITVPDRPLYLLRDVQRGDEMRDWSPDEALPAITGAGRTPLTVHEGISWLLQQPERLEPGSCFMTVGSRRRGPGGRLDARTPALWISGGTGHDGPERRGAPKVGWCWAGNRHTWLGFASAAGRIG